MIIRFKSEEAMYEFSKIGPNNQGLVDWYGMRNIKIDRISYDWWDIVDPNDGYAIFTINIDDESKYFDIVQ